jgi:hypothetical protein
MRLEVRPLDNLRRRAVVNPALNVSTLPELVVLAKRQPQKRRRPHVA